MDLRQLRYFVAVAEELHFTRAAARLHLAQSALSAQIRSLEEELGGPLFTRSNRGVALTEAGQRLLDGARTLLCDADRLLTEVRAGAAGSISIGCFGPVPGDLLGDILDELHRRRPSAEPKVHAFGFAEILRCVKDGRADVAFLYPPYADDELAGLEVVPLREEPRCVALASTHPLAARGELTPQDLADEVFVTATEAVSQVWRDLWLLTDELGRRPAVSRHATDSIDEWLHLVRSGAGVDTCPAVVAEYYRWPGLAFVPLVGARPITLAVAFRADRRSALVADVVDIAVARAAV